MPYSYSYSISSLSSLSPCRTSPPLLFHLGMGAINEKARCTGGGDIWCSNWEQRIVYYVDLGEMEYKCVYREGQKLLSRAKVWSTLSTTTLDFEYSPTRMI